MTPSSLAVARWLRRGDTTRKTRGRRRRLRGHACVGQSRQASCPLLLVLSKLTTKDAPLRIASAPEGGRAAMQDQRNRPRNSRLRRDEPMNKGLDRQQPIQALTTAYAQSAIRSHAARVADLA